MVQLTLTTGTGRPEEVKVPIFIYSDEEEVDVLAKLIAEVKPSYLINCSNSVESLKSYVASGKVAKDIVYIFNSTAVAEIEEDKKLLTKIRVINLFN